MSNIFGFLLALVLAVTLIMGIHHVKHGRNKQASEGGEADEVTRTEGAATYQNHDSTVQKKFTPATKKQDSATLASQNSISQSVQNQQTFGPEAKGAKSGSSTNIALGSTANLNESIQPIPNQSSHNLNLKDKSSNNMSPEAQQAISDLRQARQDYLNSLGLNQDQLTAVQQAEQSRIQAMTQMLQSGFNPQTTQQIATQYETAMAGIMGSDAFNQYQALMTQQAQHLKTLLGTADTSHHTQSP